MSKKDSKKDVSQVEEVDLNSIIGSEGIFDLGKIREKAIASKEMPPISINKDTHNDNEDEDEHIDEIDHHTHEIEEIIEDDILPLRDEDLLLLEDDLGDFEEEDDEDDEDEEDEDGTGRKKRER